MLKKKFFFVNMLFKSRSHLLNRRFYIGSVLSRFYISELENLTAGFLSLSA